MICKANTSINLTIKWNEIKENNPASFDPDSYPVVSCPLWAVTEQQIPSTPQPPPPPPATTFPHMQLASTSLIYLRETRGMTGEESGLMTCLAEASSQLFGHTTRICKVSYGPCTKMNFKKNWCSGVAL